MKIEIDIDAIANSEELDNELARILINKICQRYGWQHSVFCTEDISAELESRLIDATGEAIDAVMATWHWRGLGVVMDSHGYEMLLKAVDEATGTESEELEAFKKWGD